jgi:Na+-transporting NADH:ubiquinone oxidoreductase subunit NqrF
LGAPLDAEDLMKVFVGYGQKCEPQRSVCPSMLTQNLAARALSFLFGAKNKQTLLHVAP